ncbi:MAG: hypothetical protein Kow0042_00300 [Calditrichia bacterium]
MLRLIILLLFLISGFTGLLYEVVWVRLFGLIFGNTTLAISSVLASFMLGLALGSLFIGFRADRIKNHLKMFAALELGVALTAPLILLLQSPLEALFTLIHSHWPGNSTALYGLKFFLAFLIMLPATFLMGGTLPVLSRALIQQKENLGRGIGVLYGINTLGAVLGTLLTGFFLIRILGVSHSIFLAIGLDLLIALLAFLLSRRSRESRPGLLPARERALFSTDPRARQIILIMALSGFAALGYEVIWSRVLVFALTNSVYAFTVMLATFLLGLTTGSLVGSRFIDRLADIPRWLGATEIGIGLSGLLTAFLLANLNDLHHAIFSLNPRTTWFNWNSIRFLEALLIMFIPTFLMGLSFPLASKIIVPRISRTGEGVGWLYFFNTIGGVLGSLTVGFVLLNFWGSGVAVVTLVFVNLAVGGWLLWQRGLPAPLRKWLLYAGVTVVLFGVALGITPAVMFSGAYSLVESGFPIIDFREGIEGTVTVHQGALPMQRTRRIDVDGLNVAGTSFMLRTLQVLQGHLPNLVHGPAQRVLQIGFGTGQTSHSALTYPIEDFTVIEISRDVLELSAKHFTDINEGVLQNPRFRAVISDGKNFVKYAGGKYDIIMNDANYAVATASASLFTRDHFLNCRERLKPGGILSTWMTTDLDPQDFAIVLKTFQSVFPYSLLWMAPNCINKQVVLMGSSKPMKLDVAWMEAQLQREEVKKDLAAVNIRSVYDLLSCLVLDSEGIRQISEGAPVNTDDHPILEYSTKAIRARDLCAFQNLGSIIRRPPDRAKLLVNPPDSLSFPENLQRYAAAAQKLLQGMLVFYQGKTRDALEILLTGSRMIPESRLAAEYFRHMDIVTAQLSYEIQQDPGALGPRLKMLRHKIAARQFEPALKMCRELSEQFGENPLLQYESARVHFSLNQLEAARQELERALALNPQLSGAWYLLGIVQKNLSQPQAARASLQRALQLDPRIYEAYNALGGIEMAEGHSRKAVGYFQESLRLLEFQPEIWANLGECYFNSGDYRAAIKAYEEALSGGLRTPEVYAGLANSYYFLKSFPRSEFYLDQAIRLDGGNPDYFYNLGNVRVMQGKLAEAAEAYRQAIQISPDHPDYFNNLALCYREMGNPHQALRIIREGLRHHPRAELLLQIRRSLQELVQSSK